MRPLSGRYVWLREVLLRSLAVYLPALACGAMLLLVCVPMLLSRKQTQSSEQNAQQREIEELRQEISRLKAERVLEGGGGVISG